MQNILKAEYLTWRLILLKVRLAVPPTHSQRSWWYPRFLTNYLATAPLIRDMVCLRNEKRLPFNVFFVLFFILQDILSYHKRSHQRLSPGLYLGYLKLCSSVDQIKVLVTQKLPNILCHVKIRENNNVSK